MRNLKLQPKKKKADRRQLWRQAHWKCVFQFINWAELDQSGGCRVTSDVQGGAADRVRLQGNRRGGRHSIHLNLLFPWQTIQNQYSSTQTPQQRPQCLCVWGRGGERVRGGGGGVCVHGKESISCLTHADWRTAREQWPKFRSCYWYDRLSCPFNWSYVFKWFCPIWCKSSSVHSALTHWF